MERERLRASRSVCGGSIQTERYIIIVFWWGKGADCFDYGQLGDEGGAAFYDLAAECWVEFNTPYSIFLHVCSFELLTVWCSFFSH
jgi:hypothetical protein